jgi:hypothetical protein
VVKWVGRGERERGEGKGQRGKGRGTKGFYLYVVSSRNL